MLRIVCIGDYTARYSYFTAGIMEGSIRLGHWFRPIPLIQPLKEIANQIDYFRPDVIFTHQIFSAYNEIDPVKELLSKLKKSGIKIILHAGDSKALPRFKENISEFIDIALVNRSNTKLYSDIWKIPCYHWPYFCLYQSKIVQAEEQFKAKISFSGNITGRKDPNHPHYGRAEFLEKLNKKISVNLYPNDDIMNSRFLTPVIAASSNVVIGTQLGGDKDGYIDTRPFQYIGAGALYFHERCNAIKQFFQDGVHYVAYEPGSVESVIEKYKYYVIANPDKGARIRRVGFVNCQADHSATKRIKQALGWVDK